MQQLISLIDSSLDEFETAGFGKIYTESRHATVLAIRDFWLNIEKTLVTTTDIYAHTYSYTNDIFINLTKILKYTLSMTATSVKKIMSIFISKLQVDANTKLKYSFFLEIFNYTIDSLVEENSSIDSSILLKIIEYYSYTDLPKESLGFDRYSTTPVINMRRFADTYRTNVLNKINAMSTNSQSITNALSDCYACGYTYDVWNVPEDVLIQTWGGEGLKLAKDLKNIKTCVDDLGGSDNSISGNIELISEYSKLMNMMCFSEQSQSYKHSILNNQNIFGKFYSIYASEPTYTRIYGLRFLNPFLNLKSFNTLDQNSPPYPNKIIKKFYSGFKANPYAPQPPQEALAGTLEILRVGLANIIYISGVIGDLVENTINSLTPEGSLSNFSGLGNIKYVLYMLKDLFVPTYTLATRGFNKSINYFSESLLSLADSISYTSLSNDFTEGIIPFLLKTQAHLDSFRSTLHLTGVGKGEFIANIDARLSKKTPEDRIKFFKRNQYHSSVIDGLLNITTTEQLINEYADDFVDSQDIYSFFKAYENVQYLYMIGGERAISSFLEYLYSPSVTNIRKIYALIERNLSKYEYINRFKLGKLIGSLLYINSATNQNKINSYASILKAKNSSILQSLTLLDAIGVDPLNPIEEVNVLSDYISQLSSRDVDYSDIVQNAPIALNTWLGVFDSAASASANTQLLTEFLTTSSDITPQDLETFFKTDNNRGISILGGLLSGIRGGTYTKLLRHFTLSGGLVGVVHSSSRYEVTNDLFINELDESLETLSKLISLVYNRIQYGFDRIMTEASTTTTTPQLTIMPAGVGNSPASYKFISKYTIPENVVTSKTVDLVDLSNSTELKYTTQSDYARRFIRTTTHNELASDIVGTSAQIPHDYSIPTDYNQTTSRTYLEKINFRHKYVRKNVSATTEGYDLTTPGAQTLEDICIRAGLQDCEQYSDTPIFEIYEQTLGGVPIQRALMSIPEINPSGVFLPNSYKTPPSYFSILPDIAGVGINGEPIFIKSPSEPPEMDSGLTYDYCHTSLALSSFRQHLTSSIETPKDCLQFENNLSEYIKCVNVLLCQKSPNLHFCDD